ncbi:MAG TPA: hypothetical protein VMR33_08060 [Candidatus Baltobacteraceae bacterium]|jgi:hypothetical protein|nr:hypothetical protein [Candidatus Baltobacteraceae bacterium]
MAKIKAKKGKKLTASGIEKVKEVRVGGKHSAKSDVEGQATIITLNCWACGQPNNVATNWQTFLCWNDHVLNGNPYYSPY